MILYRYLVGEYSKLLSLCLAGLAAVYFTIDFFGKFRRFLEDDAATATVITYFALRLPKMVADVLPVSVLMATLITLGILTRTNELTAIKACGISLYRALAPFLAVAALATAGVLGANLRLIPVLEQRAEYLRKVKIEGREAERFFRSKHLWLRHGDQFINILLADPERQTLEGVRVYRVGSDFTLRSVIEAERAVFVQGRWIMPVATERVLAPDAATTERRLSDAPLDITRRPKEFRQLVLEPPAMTFGELRRFVAQLRAEGLDDQRYAVDLHAKTALPFVNLVMALVGLSLGLHESRARGTGRGIALSLVVALGYWFSHSLALSLGHGGLLPPWLAAWMANLIFAAFGGFLLLGARQ